MEKKQPSTLKALLNGNAQIPIRAAWTCSAVSFIAGILLVALIVSVHNTLHETPDNPVIADQPPVTSSTIGKNDHVDYDTAQPSSDVLVEPIIDYDSTDLNATQSVATQPSKTADEVKSEAEEAAERERVRYLNAQASKTYIYTSPSEIPAELPVDCGRLKFSVSDLQHYDGEVNVIAEFDYVPMGYHFTVVENLDLGTLSLLNYQSGYNLIAVLCENENRDRAYLTVMSYNPVEEPMITIQMSAYDKVASAAMDLAVFHLSFYSDIPMGDGVYQSNGAADLNYDWWGSSYSGDTDYEFSATSVQVLTEARRKSRLDTATEYLIDYLVYWNEHSSQVMKLRTYFNSDRSRFDMDGYARYLGYTITRQSTGHRTYTKGDFQIDIATNPGNPEDTGEPEVIIKVNDEEVYYGGYYSARVNNLPDTIKVSGNMVLNQDDYEQLDIVLLFLERGKPY